MLPTAEEIQLARLYESLVRKYMGEGDDRWTSSKRAMVEVERAAASDDES